MELLLAAGHLLFTLSRQCNQCWTSSWKVVNGFDEEIGDGGADEFRADSAGSRSRPDILSGYPHELTPCSKALNERARGPSEAAQCWQLSADGCDCATDSEAGCCTGLSGQFRKHTSILTACLHFQRQCAHGVLNRHSRCQARAL